MAKEISKQSTVWQEYATALSSKVAKQLCSVQLQRWFVAKNLHAALKSTIKTFIDHITLGTLDEVEGWRPSKRSATFTTPAQYAVVAAPPKENREIEWSRN